jgi:hypothetical protein
MSAIRVTAVLVGLQEFPRHFGTSPVVTHQALAGAIHIRNRQPP